MAQEQQIKLFTRAIQKVLTPDLLNAKWAARNAEPGADPLTGYCYPAAEALYYLLGGKQAGWKPVVLSHKDWPEGLPEEDDTHRFLEHEDGTIADPSAGQFGKLKIPYEKGRGSGFMTKDPSKRAQTILERLGVEDPLKPASLQSWATMAASGKTTASRQR